MEKEKYMIIKMICYKKVNIPKEKVMEKEKNIMKMVN
jgi:hypothetical protein